VGLRNEPLVNSEPCDTRRGQYRFKGAPSGKIGSDRVGGRR